MMIYGGGIWNGSDGTGRDRVRGGHYYASVECAESGFLTRILSDETRNAVCN
jgi:hypothetical protein